MTTTSKTSGRLLVDLRDNAGQPIKSKTLVLLAENKPALGKQYRLESEGRGDISEDFPPGAYTLQAYAAGHEVGRAFAGIEPGKTTEIKLVLPPAKTYHKPELAKRLDIYGLSADKLKLSPLTVSSKQTVRLDYRRHEDNTNYALIRPKSVNDLKRWHGNPDGAFGHDQPRFGKLPSTRRLTEQELKDVAREYIYGNSKSVAKYGSLIDQYIAHMDISVAVFFYTIITINDGAILEVGNGSSVLFADILRIHKNGILSVVGDMRVDVGLYERFG
jgi:hypothetical protein